MKTVIALTISTMKWLCWLIMVAVILASQTGEAQETQQATLTLLCKGTGTSSVHDFKEPGQPVSMGVVVNFTSHTVQGFGRAADEVAPITAASDAAIDFNLSASVRAESDYFSIEGSIDRVTGDASVTIHGGSGPVLTTILTLNCRPAQRMF